MGKPLRSFASVELFDELRLSLRGSLCKNELSFKPYI